MSPKKEIVTSGAAGQSGSRGRVKHIKLLNEGEFRECFGIPNRVSVQLLEGDVVPTEKSGDNPICFTKEQFNAGLRLPLSSLFKQFLHYMIIPPALIHPNVIRVLMGCNILDMLFILHLSLLEVIFVYTIKKTKNDIFSLSASIPSLQLVTGLPDSTKGAARGHVLVKGPWAGLLVHREKEFVPNQSLRIPGGNIFSLIFCVESMASLARLLTCLVFMGVGTDKRGRLVEWVEKASFDRLNKLFEIMVGERNCQTLLSTRNLRAVTQISQPYILNIIPRRLPKKVVSGEYFVLKDLPFYMEAHEADAQARQERLNQREEKR